jgi:RNA polymerase sigma factor (TIGR02999 family)
MEPPISYDDLWLFQDDMKKAAHTLLSREYNAASLQTTALLVTALRRLRRSDQDWSMVTWQNRAHFFGALREAMRRALIDHGRARRAEKRQVEMVVPPDILAYFDVRQTMARAPGFAAILGEALERLKHNEPRWTELIEYRIYMGLTLKQTAKMMGVSVRTLQNWWEKALGRLTEDIERMISEER